MRRSFKGATSRLSADSQRMIALCKALIQASSRVEERAWERDLDALLHKALRLGHQADIDAALDQLFKTRSEAYEVLMDGVEAGSESCIVEHDGKQFQALLIAAPILAWTRFAIASGPFSQDLLLTLVGAIAGARAGRRYATGDGAAAVFDRPVAQEPFRHLRPDPAPGPGRARQDAAAHPGQPAGNRPFPGRYALPAGRGGGAAGCAAVPLAGSGQPGRTLDGAGAMAGPGPAQRRAPAAGLRHRTAFAGRLLHGLPRRRQGDPPGFGEGGSALPDAYPECRPGRTERGDRRLCRSRR